MEKRNHLNLLKTLICYKEAIGYLWSEIRVLVSLPSSNISSVKIAGRLSGFPQSRGYQFKSSSRGWVVQILLMKKSGERFLREMRNRVASVEGYNMGQLFDSCLTTVGIILFLDGLDEVSGDNYPAISAALRGLSSLLAAKSDKNAIIITMRIQYYQEIQDQLSDDFPKVAYIRPFNPNEIYTFLTKWPFADRPQRNITRIYADLTDRPTLRTMCSNPLVLAMYVAKDQTQATGEVPESRTDFYRSVVDELLVLRRRRQEIVRGPSRAVNSEKRSSGSWRTIT